MREAINENRTLQLVLLGILALGAGFFLLRMGGSGGEETETAAVPAPAGAGAPAVSPDVQATVAAASGAGTAASGGAKVPATMVPGPGIPKSLLRAYRRGDAIVLLVRRDGALDDALVRDSVELLSSLRDVEVFVTRAEHIYRYTWLTQGVNVTELPALVVLRPRKLSKGKAVGTVSYGFRRPASVLQAVEDALYRGPTGRPYHP